MKLRSTVIIFILATAMALPAQKSRVLAVVQMIDASSYSDAKEEIELALLHKRTGNWPRTSYVKGLLCQTAWEEGLKKDDAKMTGLYPDQLFEAYTAYERARELDVRGRLDQSIGQKYYLLSNDFRNLGEKSYNNAEYAEAFRAFEAALMIAQSDLVKAETDTALIYNTAMAAVENKNWDKAIAYLSGLHEAGHAASTTILLADALQSSANKSEALSVLEEGLELYNYEESLVMYLANQMVEHDQMEAALELFDKAITRIPDNYKFHWARGLVNRRMGKQDAAIADFRTASVLDPGNPTIYYHMGVTFYNMAIELREEAMGISQNSGYQRARGEYLEYFKEAVDWLEKSYELDPSNDETAAKLYQLYYQLKMKEKQEDLDLRIINTP